MDSIQRLELLQKKVNELNNKKIGAEKELELLKVQHNNLVKELKEMGVEDINDLPNLILKLENELNQKLTDAEENVKRTELQISSFQEEEKTRK